MTSSLRLLLIACVAAMALLAVGLSTHATAAPKPSNAALAKQIKTLRKQVTTLRKQVKTLSAKPGTPGPQGAAGANGTNGTNGADGAQGPAGVVLGLQGRQSAGAINLTTTRQDMTSRALPAAGSYMVTVNCDFTASSDSLTKQMLIDASLRHPGGDIVADDVNFVTNLSAIFIAFGTTTWSDQALITVSGPTTLTASAKIDSASSGVTASVNDCSIVALQVGSAEGATPVG